MNLNRLLFSSLAFLVCASTNKEGLKEFGKEAGSIFPMGSLQQIVFEVNKSRYQLENVTFTATASKDKPFLVNGVAEIYPDQMTLLHPNFWTYWIHTIAQIIAAIMALYLPRTLLVILVGAVLCWPISLAFNKPIWHMQPLTTDWNLMFVKSVIVNIAPTLPMMLCLIKKPSRGIRQCAAVWMYCILWVNIAWTLCFLPISGFNPISVVNGVCGVSLCISLIIHNVALCKRGFTLCEVQGDIIHGYSTSLSWLVCYTVWNALFVLEYAVGLTLQDIAFWAMMIFFYYHSDGRSSVENYFRNGASHIPQYLHSYERLARSV